jgi:hypothetical protein
MRESERDRKKQKRFSNHFLFVFHSKGMDRCGIIRCLIDEEIRKGQEETKEIQQPFFICISFQRHG